MCGRSILSKIFYISAVTKVLPCHVLTCHLVKQNGLKTESIKFKFPKIRVTAEKYLKGCCSLSYSALKEIFFSNFIAGFAVKDAAVSLIQHLKV